MTASESLPNKYISRFNHKSTRAKADIWLKVTFKKSEPGIDVFGNL